jgi:hypothetical protein
MQKGTIPHEETASGSKFYPMKNLSGMPNLMLNTGNQTSSPGLR